MANPTIRIHDLETNEIIDRPMTNEEYAAYKADVESAITQREDAAAAKQAVLDKLGLTADELAAIL